jgi:hypothetical protein
LLPKGVPPNPEKPPSPSGKKGHKRLPKVKEHPYEEGAGPGILTDRVDPFFDETPQKKGWE